MDREQKIRDLVRRRRFYPLCLNSECQGADDPEECVECEVKAILALLPPEQKTIVVGNEQTFKEVHQAILAANESQKPAPPAEKPSLAEVKATIQQERGQAARELYQQMFGKQPAEGELVECNWKKRPGGCQGVVTGTDDCSKCSLTRIREDQRAYMIQQGYVKLPSGDELAAMFNKLGMVYVTGYTKELLELLKVSHED